LDIVGQLSESVGHYFHRGANFQFYATHCWDMFFGSTKVHPKMDHVRIFTLCCK